MRVGIFPKTGVIIVYDPELQTEAGGEIDAYVVQRGIARRFAIADIRGNVKTLLGQGRQHAIINYLKWKSTDSDNYIEQQKETLLRQTEALQAERVARHRSFIESRGGEYEGYRVRKNGTFRSTHCWNCKKDIDNLSLLECAKCGWIICRCGACNCAR